MKLQAYVFCDCFAQGRVKRPPPNPDIVKVCTNGDNGCIRPTPAQSEAYEAWRLHACRHLYGTVTGGELGHRLPREALHRAMVPYRRTFPIFVGKVLGHKARNRHSHLTLKQVAKLKVELTRFKDFHLADRKLEKELQYYRGQMKQLVRAALKFKQPIAM